MDDGLHGQSRYQRGATPAARPRVVVAEDDPDVRAVVSIALRGLGYQVVEARSGAELFEALSGALLGDEGAARPDVIVSDMRMPGLSGLEILAVLRDARWSTVFVLMTAHADHEIIAEAARLGADALFEKPFDIDDLMTAIINLAPAPAWPKGRYWH